MAKKFNVIIKLVGNLQLVMVHKKVERDNMGFGMCFYDQKEHLLFISVKMEGFLGHNLKISIFK
jgi:hypothetical protein